jgi:hypothetical protein
MGGQSCVYMWELQEDLEAARNFAALSLMNQVQDSAPARQRSPICIGQGSYR